MPTPTPTALLVSLTVPDGAGSCASAADDTATHPSAMSQPQASFLSMVLLLTSWIDYTGCRIAPRPPLGKRGNRNDRTLRRRAKFRRSRHGSAGLRDGQRAARAEARGPYMLRRYCPPTSNSAFVIWPSEHTRTVFTSSANTLPSSTTVCLSFAS